MKHATSRRAVLGLMGAGTASVAWAAPALAAARPASSGPTSAAGPAVPPRGLRDFERFVAAQAAQDRFAGTVLIAHRERPLLQRSYGLADQERALPNTHDTVFCVASITKVFTALAIAQLVEQGRMGFHDTLGSHLEGFPASVADTVTVHQLLTHTSGVGRPALGQGPPVGADWTNFDQVMDETLAIVRRTPLQITPGTAHVYSNDGFFVLGAIVARVSGQSYFDYVRRNVFGPAGMSRTDFIGKPQVIDDRSIARPYWTQPDGTRVDASTSPFIPFSYGPAGGAYSTAADLLAFARALTANTLLGAAYTALITGGKVALPPTEPATQVQFYGYGHSASVVRGRSVFGHSGSGPGMSNRLDIHPETEHVAVVLSNYDTRIDPIVQKERELLAGVGPGNATPGN